MIKNFVSGKTVKLPLVNMHSGDLIFPTDPEYPTGEIFLVATDSEISIAKARARNQALDDFLFEPRNIEKVWRSRGDVYQEYREYCADKKVTAKIKVVFFESIGELGIKTRRTNTGHEVYFWAQEKSKVKIDDGISLFVKSLPEQKEWILRDRIYAQYSDFCLTQRIEIKTRQKFYRDLENMGAKQKRLAIGIVMMVGIDN